VSQILVRAARFHRALHYVSLRYESFKRHSEWHSAETSSLSGEPRVLQPRRFGELPRFKVAPYRVDNTATTQLESPRRRRATSTSHGETAVASTCLAKRSRTFRTSRRLSDVPHAMHVSLHAEAKRPPSRRVN